MGTNDDDLDDILEIAANSIEWIEAYTGDDIGSLSSSEKNAAINAFWPCINAILFDANGDEFSEEERKKHFEAAISMIEWIEVRIAA